jgi:hypothetical protein
MRNSDLLIQILEKGNLIVQKFCNFNLAPRARLLDEVFQIVKSAIFQKYSRLVGLPTYQADIGARLV